MKIVSGRSSDAPSRNRSHTASALNFGKKSICIEWRVLHLHADVALVRSLISQRQAVLRARVFRQPSWFVVIYLVWMSLRLFTRILVMPTDFRKASASVRPVCFLDRYVWEPSELCYLTLMPRYEAKFQDAGPMQIVSCMSPRFSTEQPEAPVDWPPGLTKEPVHRFRDPVEAWHRSRQRRGIFRRVFAVHQENVPYVLSGFPIAAHTAACFEGLRGSTMLSLGENGQSAASSLCFL